MTLFTIETSFTCSPPLTQVQADKHDTLYYHHARTLWSEQLRFSWLRASLLHGSTIHWCLLLRTFPVRQHAQIRSSKLLVSAIQIALLCSQFAWRRGLWSVLSFFSDCRKVNSIRLLTQLSCFGFDSFSVWCVWRDDFAATFWCRAVCPCELWQLRVGLPAECCVLVSLYRQCGIRVQSLWMLSWLLRSSIVMYRRVC